MRLPFERWQQVRHLARRFLEARVGGAAPAVRSGGGEVAARRAWGWGGRSGEDGTGWAGWGGQGGAGRTIRKGEPARRDATPPPPRRRRSCRRRAQRRRGGAPRSASKITRVRGLRGCEGTRVTRLQGCEGCEVARRRAFHCCSGPSASRSRVALGRAGSSTSLGREGAPAQAAGSVQKRTAAVELPRAAVGVRGLRRKERSRWRKGEPSSLLGAR